LIRIGGKIHGSVPHIAVDALQEAGEMSPGAERTEALKEAVLSL